MNNRTSLILNSDIINKIENIKILLVGVGGVGGSCFEMLVRLGFLNITIVDFDKFEESNLNRQILSLKDNIGIEKVLVAKERALSINDKINISTFNFKLDENSINNLEDYDYIIDACDDVKAKILLIKYAIKNNIKIISSCGTGNRINPSLLEITNIWKTKDDPLAKKIRYQLRKENIKYKVPVVCSSEQPVKNQKVGSISLVPNAAGILLASYIINDILK